MTLKSAFSLILLALAACAALAAKDRIPAPYFTDGENLSAENCGVGEKYWVAEVLFRSKIRCIGVIISQWTVLTHTCELPTDDITDVSVYIGDCLKEKYNDVTNCTGKIEVRGINLMNIDLLEERAYEFPIYILRTKNKMPANISPICLFNRGNEMDLVEDPQTTYFSWAMLSFHEEKHYKGEKMNVWWYRFVKIGGKIVSDDNCLEYLRRRVDIAQPSLQTRFLCVRQPIFSESTGVSFLMNIYRGRYFIRGMTMRQLSERTYGNISNTAYVDILPYVESIVWNSDDMSVLSPVPPVKSIRTFRGSDDLSFPNCGLKSRVVRSRRETGDEVEEIRSHQLILAGRRALNGAHPWHATIQGDGFACGGSLVSKRAVLTAAHCIEGQRAEDFEVTIGMYNRTVFNSTEIQIKTPSRLKVHPKYSRGKFHYDVGLMIFDKGFELTDHVRPICLWNEDTNLDAVAGKSALVAGYGYFKNYSHPETLQEAQIPIRSHLECYHSLRKYYGARLKPGDNFCAGYTNGTTVCNGDSGSSLSLEKDGRWFIRGIVSFAKSKKVKINGAEAKVCDPDAFPLFSDVAYYMDWIVHNTPGIYFNYLQDLFPTFTLPSDYK
ncbi:uncharacterized protein LOC135936798 [Cloeon dipterum]|uniref:uncharacterized protein LOC135936798 n=1 Tax=Cloeon dipterum TaxID=197152 RepID=UPI00322057DA